MISKAVRFLPAMAGIFVPGIASMLLATGAAQAQRAPSVHPGWEESGEASWYGGRHNGRRTSDGSIFNDQQMTAAHATLPLGTTVRVTMQDTGRSVVVRITDRQPPKYIRVIDLSRGAASRIGLLNRGTAMVTLAPAKPGDIEEVADAAEGAVYDNTDRGSITDGTIRGGAPQPRGRRHMRPGARAAAADRPCCRAPSAVRVQHSARPQAEQRTL